MNYLIENWQTILLWYTGFSVLTFVSWLGVHLIFDQDEITLGDMFYEGGWSFCPLVNLVMFIVIGIRLALEISSYVYVVTHKLSRVVVFKRRK